MLLALLIAAAATPGVDVDCILGRLPASAVAGLLVEVETGEAGEVREAFNTARDGCARDRNWTSRQRDRFERLAVSWVVVEQTTEVLRNNGIPPAIILGWYQALSPAERADQGQASLDGLLDTLAAAGATRAQLEAHAPSIGLLLGALQMAEQADAEAHD